MSEINFEYNNMTPFKWFIIDNFPFLEDGIDALTNYQLFCKLGDEINKNRDAINSIGENEEDLVNAFNSLHDYVEYYFNNLDVTDEINAKLDKMAQDGTLTNLIKPYIDNDIMPIINNQNARIETINTKVEAIENINPIPVTSTSDMTDTTKIYVNVTDGKWYYYNGETWAIGGTYQASQSINDVEGLLTAYNTNELKGLFDFEVGNVNTQTGELSGSTVFIRTHDIHTAPEDLYIDYSSYTKTNIFLYNNDGTFNRLNAGYQNANKGYWIEKGTHFRLVLDYVTIPEGGRPNISGDPVDETDLYINFHIYKYKDYKQMQMKKLSVDGISFESDNIKNYIDWTLGDYGSSTHLVQTASDFRRILPTHTLHFTRDVILSANNTCSVYLWYFDDEDDTNPSGQGWKNIYSTPFVVPAGTYFRPVVSQSYSYNTALYNVYDNDVFTNFVMSFESVDTSGRYKNPNVSYINSVAHQGYSLGADINYCKLEGYQNAKDYGFNYGELDLQMTSDGVLVCSHDSTFDPGTGSVDITTSTYDDIKDLNYHGGNIATFEQIVSLSKQIGLGLYIDKLYNLSTAGWTSMFSIIKKYQMQDNVVYLIGSSQEHITKILNFNPRAKFEIITESTDFTSIVTLINANKTNLNHFSIDASYSNFDADSLLNATINVPVDIGVELWTIDNIDTYKSFLPYVSGITSNKYSIMQVLDSN